MYRLMDLNSDGTISPMEASAWFKRVEYMVCKDHRFFVEDIAYVDSQVPFYDLLDADKNGEIDPFDVIVALEKIDMNEDKQISRAEFDQVKGSSHAYMESHCMQIASYD